MANTKITTNVIADNAVGITQLNVSDGSNGQVLTTNGSGTLSFSTVSGTTINNNANNRVITGSGTANTLEGEANFVFDASNSRVGIGTTSPANNLHIHTDSGDEGLTIKSTGDTSNAIIIDANRGNAGAAINALTGKWNGTSVADILFLTGDDTTNKDDGVITFRTSSADNIAERMRINTSGLVGIGETSPTHHLHVNAGATNVVAVFESSDTEATIRMKDNTGTAAIKCRNDFRFNKSESTELMRINSSSHLLVGTTSDAALDGVSPGICVGSTSSTTSGISFSNANHEWLIYNASDGKLRFYDSTNNTEFAFVDTSRRFTFGGNFAHSTYAHTAVFGANSVPLGTVVMEDFDVSSGIGNTVLNLFLRDQDPATNAKFIQFRDGGGAVGSIIHNDDGGGVTYNTTSDYRLKENVDYDWDATTLLKQLKPCKFNFKKAPDRTVQGMLAHEVKDIVPYSVTGDKDHMMEIGTIKNSDGNTVYEGVYEHFCKTDEGQTWTKTGTEPYYQELDYSRLVPLLTKALQEQQTIIEDLKTRIETLEG